MRGSSFQDVFRGGSWNNSASLCRSADRRWNEPGDRDAVLGFRFCWRV